jgi:hypothetical protein
MFSYRRNECDGKPCPEIPSEGTHDEKQNDGWGIFGFFKKLMFWKSSEPTH